MQRNAKIMELHWKFANFIFKVVHEWWEASLFYCLIVIAYHLCTLGKKLYFSQNFLWTSIFSQNGKIIFPFEKKNHFENILRKIQTFASVDVLHSHCSSCFTKMAIKDAQDCRLLWKYHLKFYNLSLSLF